MKLRMGGPKSGIVWGSFLVLFCVLMYFGFLQLALLAFAGFMISFLVGMVVERREHEAKRRTEETDPNAKRPA